MDPTTTRIPRSEGGGRERSYVKNGLDHTTKHLDAPLVQCTHIPNLETPVLDASLYLEWLENNGLTNYGLLKKKLTRVGAYFLGPLSPSGISLVSSRSLSSPNL